MAERPNRLRLYTRPHSYRSNLMDDDDDDDDSDLEAGEESQQSTSTKTLNQPLEQTVASAGAKTSKAHPSGSPTPSYASTSVPESSMSNVNSGKGIVAVDKGGDDDYSNGKKKKKRNRGILSYWPRRQDNDWFQRWSENWMHSHWPILLVSVLVFAVLAGAGIALYLVVAHSQEDDMQDKIMDLAVETGDVRFALYSNAPYFGIDYYTLSDTIILLFISIFNHNLSGFPKSWTLPSCPSFPWPSLPRNWKSLRGYQIKSSRQVNPELCPSCLIEKVRFVMSRACVMNRSWWNDLLRLPQL